jgi:protein-tyrosine-phosphatase
MKKVLFVCEYNDGRSQIAEAFFNHYAKGKAQASSSGMHFANHIDRIVVQAMKEKGMDLSSKRPKMTTLEMLGVADKVISMGCGGASICPATYVPTEEWQVENLVGKPIGHVRAIRDGIEMKVKKLLEEI